MTQTKGWVSVTDIVDWNSREPGVIKPSDELSDSTIQQIIAAVAAGEFNDEGITRILCLSPCPNALWGRLSADRLNRARAGGPSGQATMLEHCWIEHHLVEKWHDRRKLRRPDHLLPRKPKHGLDMEVHAIASPESRPSAKVERALSSGNHRSDKDDPGNLVIRNKPGGGGLKRDKATEAMIDAVLQNTITFDELCRMKQKTLHTLFPNARRTLLAVARNTAVEWLNDNSFRTSGNTTATKDITAT